MSPDLPADVTTEAVLDLYAQFLEADRDGASSAVPGGDFSGESR